MSKFEVRDVVCDYGIYENGELKLILNSRGSALKILKILEFDNSLKNEARPYNDTNFDKITESVESLAELLIKRETREHYDFFREETVYSVDYISPSGNGFKTQTDALKDTIEWLQKECE